MQTQPSKVFTGRVNRRGRSIDLKKRLLPDEPKTVVRFTNVESPKTPLTFSYPVPVEKDMPDPHNPGKKIRMKVNEYEQYALLDGYTYELPDRIIDHINSLTIPVCENRPDPETGDIVSVRVGDSPRFNLVPVRTAKPANTADTGKGKKETPPAGGKE